MSIEASVKKQTKIMRRLPRINPKTFIVAGRAIIPAPTTVVDKLNTAPEKEAPLSPSWTPSSPSWCFSGSRGLVSLTKGFCFRDLLSGEANIVIFSDKTKHPKNLGLFRWRGQTFGSVWGKNLRCESENLSNRWHTTSVGNWWRRIIQPLHGNLFQRYLNFFLL